MDINLDTWIISDTHFGHKNIVKYCRRPVHHDFIMQKAWFDRVKSDEDILHLGDVFMGAGSLQKVQGIFPTLPGNKALIKGNHDNQGDKVYEALGFTLLPKRVYFEWEGKRVLFSHYPERTAWDWDINIHGHIHNNGYAPGASKQRDYRNVSVEVTQFRPVRLGDILTGVPGSYQSVKDAPAWPLSQITNMVAKGRLDEHFMEIERL